MGIVNPQVRKVKLRGIFILPGIFAPIWHTRKMALTFQPSRKETVYMQVIHLEVITGNQFLRSL